MLAAVFFTTCQTVFSEMPRPQSLSARQTHRNNGPFSIPAAGHASSVSFRQHVQRGQWTLIKRVLNAYECLPTYVGLMEGIRRRYTHSLSRAFMLCSRYAVAASRHS